MDVVMKTLGLVRNLLSNKSQIDHVMALYGKQVNPEFYYFSRGG
jgi:hypothetical protein